MSAGKIARSEFIAWDVLTRVRYRARQLAFALPFVRKALEREQLNPDHAAQHWDKLLSETHFRSYLGDTITVNACNAMTAILIKFHAPKEPSVLDIGCAGGALLPMLMSYSQYLGIDVSAHAIEVARSIPKMLLTYNPAGRHSWRLICVNTSQIAHGM